MRVTERMKNIFSILLCLCMLVQNVPVMAFAATGDNLCDHHIQHTAECGYAEGCEGAPCNHVHSEDCYVIVECTHTCSDECDDPCTHECTVESGCVNMELDCRHVHGDCGYSQGTSEVPCGHSHNESCGYVAGTEGVPCAYAETNPECDHSGDCGFVAAADGQPCGHTVCDETCGYAPATEGTPCTHTHSVKVNSDDSCYALLCSHKDGNHDGVCGYVAAVQPHDCSYQCEECVAALAAGETTVPSTDPVCTCETKCSDDGINGECAVCSAEGADLITCTGKEADSVCTCESGDPEWHAPFCSLYVIPENPECFCAEKCTADIFNEWCDVCYADYTSCSGEDLAVTYLPNGYIAISTPEELDRIRNDLSGKYMLTANIDLTDALAVGGSLYDSKGWIAIGYASSPQPFTGILDGNGYTISGVTAKGGLGIAHLIYENRGTIKNLTVSGNFTYGGVFCHNNAGLIQNCHNNAEVKISLFATSQSDRGGLVNNNLAGGIVECCSNRATIQGTVASGGGSGDKGLHLGGIAGRNTGIIRKCYNTGNLTGVGKKYTNIYVAGIVGEGASGSTIENCYNTGSIRAELTESGYQSANNVAAGGILATVYYQSSTTIKNCYNAGSISLSGPYHNQYLGSISGFPAKSTFTNCYYLSGTCGYAAYNKTSYSSIDKLTENQMRTQAAFVGFDFSNTWSMGLSGYYYPILKAGCPHTVTNVPATPATCLKDGNIEYWYCSTCGRYFNSSSKTKEITRADTVIPRGHTWDQLLVAATEAVHTQTELKAPVAAHYYCAVCETYFDTDKNATTLEALTGTAPQHSYGDWINTDDEKHWKACVCGLKSQEGNHSFDTEVEGTRVPPTSESSGSVTMQCVCGATKVETLDALDPVYTVKFDMKNHGSAIAPQSVQKGNMATAPEAPTAEGYYFDGWYTNSACVTSSAFDFSTPITSDLTLYAKWVSIEAHWYSGSTLIGFGPIEDAVAAANENEAITLIQMQKDATIGEGWLYLTSAAKPLTLDLNGNTITCVGCWIVVRCDLTVQDSSAEKTGTIRPDYSRYGYGCLEVERGHLIIDSGNFKGSNMNNAIHIESDSSYCTINGGNFSDGTYQVRNISGNLTINGGTFTTGDWCSILVDTGSKTTIANGTFNTSDKPIIRYKGGGSLEFTGDPENITLQNKSGSAVTVENNIQLPTGYIIADGDDAVSTLENEGIYTIRKQILYQVTIVQSENGTVTADKDSCARNETVTLTVTPDKDYKLESLLINNNDVTGQVAEGTYTFTMPGQDVTVTATFKPAHVHNWVYDTIDSDGDGVADTIRETCGAGCDHSKAITLRVSSDAVYDGTRKEATVDGEIVGKYAITYDREPVDAGACTVTLAVGDTQLSLVYQIGAIAQAKPAGLAGVNETIKGLKDGKITGVDSTMEYRREGETTYTAISSTELNGLAAGNYYIRYAAKTNYTASEDAEIRISDGRMLRVYLPTEQIGYTLTVKENGSNEVAYGGSIELTYQLAAGYTQGENFAVTATEGTVTKNSNGSYTISGITADTTVSVTGISDVTAPTAEIAVTANKWTEFLNSITFDLFFKQTQQVTITVSDAGSGVKSVEYYLSHVSVTPEQIKTVDSWTDYNGTFSIDTENKYIIYAKIADNAGNVLYLSSNGIVIDRTLPVITGVTNGRTYYTTQKVTATDAYLNTLMCNGVSFGGIIPGNQKKDYTIVASDKAGNNTVFEITMLPISTLRAGLPTEETVKLKDEAAVEAVKEQVVSILSSQCDNATEEEKKELAEIIEDCDDLLDMIQQAKRVIALIDAMPEASKVSPDDKDAIDKYDAAWAAYTSKELPPASKRMVDEENKAKLDAMLKALTAYDIIHQSAKYYVKGSGKTLTFTANGYYAAYGSYVANAYGKFVDVEVDGKTVDSKNYTIKAGSTVITLKNSYLESLSAGKHTIQVNYIDGSTDGSDTFRVSINNGNPFTGDSNHIILYSCIMMASLMSMTMMVKFIPRKKGRYER